MRGQSPTEMIRDADDIMGAEVGLSEANRYE